MKNVLIFLGLAITMVARGQALIVYDSVDVGSLTGTGYDTAIVYDRVEHGLYGSFYVQFDYSDLDGDTDSLALGESAFDYAPDIYSSLAETVLPYTLDVTTNEKYINGGNNPGTYATVSFEITDASSDSRYFWILLSNGGSTTSGRYIKYKIMK